MNFHSSSDINRVTDDVIPDAEQRGWNAGYLAGEAERVALATANSDLRSDNRVLRGRLRAAYGMLNSREPIVNQPIQKWITP